ncbi:hypothetical protein ACFYP4_10005 [Streptomyces sp. NPDC005551]|uniref:hypothetical protein n=1 Tax=Streptomyces sp. NPDC005551 TaxID=3364725 RepID=UPI0036C5822B
MTTRSFSFSPSPDQPEIPADSAARPPAPPLPPVPPADPEPAAEAPPARPAQEGPVRAGPATQDQYADPVRGLVHAAVADRPLEEVVQLITLLEQSPEYARATVDALRAVGVDRSVEDVTRLVALLTRPPRSPDCADEAIRAAAESRPVEDVTRLMTLLNRAPLEQHCGEEAVRAAANRPVEELVQLIGRLAQERERDLPVHGTGLLAGLSVVPSSQTSPADLPPDDRWAPDGHGPAPLQRRPRPPRREGAAPAWPSRLAAAALLLCALAYFPLHRGSASANAYGFALGASALCLLMALVLVLRNALPVLATAVVVPTALAVMQLFEGRLRSPGLSQALEITVAPPWAAGLMSVIAALAAVTALLALLASEKLGGRPERRPLAEARRTPE